MAWQPTTSARKTRWLAPSRPDYNDFSGPSDGDYVRYVEGLMEWAQQEQERQRLEALGAKHPVTSERPPDSQWGRSPRQAVAAPVSADASAVAQTGSVESAVERLKRKAQIQAARLQQQAASKSSGSSACPCKALPPSLVFSWMWFLGLLIAVSLFATAWLPAVIVAWVVFNVFRAVRAASATGKP